MCRLAAMVIASLWKEAGCPPHKILPGKWGNLRLQTGLESFARSSRSPDTSRVLPLPLRCSPWQRIPPGRCREGERLHHLAASEFRLSAKGRICFVPGWETRNGRGFSFISPSVQSSGPHQGSQRREGERWGWGAGCLSAGPRGSWAAGSPGAQACCWLFALDRPGATAAPRPAAEPCWLPAPACPGPCASCSQVGQVLPVGLQEEAKEDRRPNSQEAGAFPWTVDDTKLIFIPFLPCKSAQGQK